MCNAWVCRGEVISAQMKNGNCASALTVQGLVANKPGSSVCFPSWTSGAGSRPLGDVAEAAVGHPAGA
eukprot:3148974-Pleurochrysis_carterae.AAC.1